jgi:hypothetical protein
MAGGAVPSMSKAGTTSSIIGSDDSDSVPQIIGITDRYDEL